MGPRGGIRRSSGLSGLPVILKYPSPQARNFTILTLLRPLVTVGLRVGPVMNRIPVMMVFVVAALASMNPDIVVVIFTQASTSLLHAFMLVRNDEAAGQSGERLTKIDPVGAQITHSCISLSSSSSSLPESLSTSSSSSIQGSASGCQG